MKQKVFDFLDAAEISYTVAEHPAVYTMAEMEEQGLDKLGTIPKNLFIRDGKGKQHFIVTAAMETQVDLKELGQKLEAKKLGLASADRLQTYLGVTPGCVSPFGVLNDDSNSVTVVFDSKLVSADKVGVHPNVHDATVLLSFEDLYKVVKLAGNPVVVLEIG